MGRSLLPGHVLGILPRHALVIYRRRYEARHVKCHNRCDRASISATILYLSVDFFSFYLFQKHHFTYIKFSNQFIAELNGLTDPNWHYGIAHAQMNSPCSGSFITACYHPATIVCSFSNEFFLLHVSSLCSAKLTCTLFNRQRLTCVLTYNKSETCKKPVLQPKFIVKKVSR